MSNNTLLEPIQIVFCGGGNGAHASIAMAANK